MLHEISLSKPLVGTEIMNLHRVRQNQQPLVIYQMWREEQTEKVMRASVLLAADDRA